MEVCVHYDRFSQVQQEEVPLLSGIVCFVEIHTCIIENLWASLVFFISKISKTLNSLLQK